jgi:hypothetical protein
VSSGAGTSCCTCRNRGPATRCPGRCANAARSRSRRGRSLPRSSPLAARRLRHGLLPQCDRLRPARAKCTRKVGDRHVIADDLRADCGRFRIGYQGTDRRGRRSGYHVGHCTLGNCSARCNEPGYPLSLFISCCRLSEFRSPTIPTARLPAHGIPFHGLPHSLRQERPASRS